MVLVGFVFNEIDSVRQLFYGAIEFRQQPCAATALASADTRA